MASFKQIVRKLVGRWSRQQETALWQMIEPKTVDHRIAGFAKSERVDVKFILFAIAPFTPLMVSDEIGLSRGVIWHAWWWLSVTWAAVMVGINLALYWRALRRSLNRNR